VAPAAKQLWLPYWLHAAKQFSLLNWAACSELVLTVELAACSEPVLAAEMGSLQQTSSRCQIKQPAANQFSLPISTLSLLGRNDLNASNNFMV